MLLKVLKDYSRFNSCSKIFSINFKYAVHEGKVKDDCSIMRNGRTDKVGTGTSWRYRNIIFIGKLEDGADFFRGSCKNKGTCRTFFSAQNIRKIFVFNSITIDDASIITNNFRKFFYVVHVIFPNRRLQEAAGPYAKTGIQKMPAIYSRTLIVRLFILLKLINSPASLDVVSAELVVVNVFRCC